MEGEVTDREQRLKRRERSREVVSDELNSIREQKKKEKHELQQIRDQDRAILEQQMERFQEQRAALLEKRRGVKEASHHRNVTTRGYSEANIEDLEEQMRILELEVSRLTRLNDQPHTELDYVDDVECSLEAAGNSTQHTDRIHTQSAQSKNQLSEIYTDDYGHQDTGSKKKLESQTVLALGRDGNVDEVSKISEVMESTNRQAIKKECEEKIDIQEDLEWIDQTYRLYGGNSEDIIRLEGERDKEQKGKETRVEDYSSEDEILLRKQIERMRLEERRLTEDIKRKEVLRQRVSRSEKENKEGERRFREARLRSLLEEKDRLNHSILEKSTTLSVLSEELEKDKEDYVKPKVRRRQLPEVPKSSEKPNIVNFKPSVPKLSEPQAFPEWKLEVQGMIESKIYNEDILKQAIRNAITGTPRKVLATLRSSATTTEILDTLESNYGNIRSGESLMEEFYTAKQGKDEDLSAWAIRLERILQLAIDKGEMEDSKKDDMLKKRFWRNLRSTELRNATRVDMKSAATFEDLKKNIRQEEMEMGPGDGKDSGDKKEVNMQQVDGNTKLMKELMDKIKGLERQIEELRRERKGDQPLARNNGGGNYRYRQRRPNRGRGYNYRNRGNNGQNQQERLNGNRL